MGREQVRPNSDESRRPVGSQHHHHRQQIRGNCTQLIVRDRELSLNKKYQVLVKGIAEQRGGIKNVKLFVGWNLGGRRRRRQKIQSFRSGLWLEKFTGPYTMWQYFGACPRIGTLLSSFMQSLLNDTKKSTWLWLPLSENVSADKDEMDPELPLDSTSNSKRIGNNCWPSFSSISLWERNSV